MKLIWKRVVLYSALILALAAAGVFLLRNNSSDNSPFNGPKSASPQQEPAMTLAVQNTPGTVTSVARGQAQFAGLDVGNALAQLEDWLRSTAGTEGTLNQDFIRAILRSLQNNPSDNRAFYLRLRHLLEDPSIDSGRKQEFITALDRAANPVAVQLLVELSRQNLPADLKRSVLMALSNVGEYYWDSASLAEAAPIMKTLWLQSQDPALLESIAIALARAGDAACLDLLMESVLSGSRSLADIENSSDPRVSASWSALKNLHNPEAVPILQNSLQSSTNNLEVSIAANLLAGMGSIDATRALVFWAQEAEDNYASIAREAFSKIGTYDSLQYLNSVMAQNPLFKSKQVLTAITSVLKKIG